MPGALGAVGGGGAHRSLQQVLYSSSQARNCLAFSACPQLPRWVLHGSGAAEWNPGVAELSGEQLSGLIDDLHPDGRIHIDPAVGLLALSAAEARLMADRLAAAADFVDRF